MSTNELHASTDDSSGRVQPGETVAQPLYLVRLSQSHTSFRKPELEALAIHAGLDLIIHDYSDTSPYCIVSLTSPSSLPASTQHTLASTYIARSILAKGIYELYAISKDGTYDTLHAAVRSVPRSTWDTYRSISFKFTVDAYCGKRSLSEQRDIIEGFSYLPLQGKISMRKPDEEFMVFEEWEGLSPEEHSLLNAGVGPKDPAMMNGTSSPDTEFTTNEIAAVPSQRSPRRLFFARTLSTHTSRHLIMKHDLKKRPYISTTSMDAELALITASLALAAPGKLFLDPFTGTGGFMVAAAELGATVLGADIDGRSFRGKSKKGLEKGVGANFTRYGIESRFGDCVTADLTNSPFRAPGRPGKGENQARWLDGIVCDPPYGVREGLKVLGRRNGGMNFLDANGRAIHDGPYVIDGVESHKLPGFIAPKRPYSFDRMLGDILEFAARTLIDGGRLAFWMPVANDADEEFPVPRHSMLEIRASCVQVFNKWSRRLLVYERLAGEVSAGIVDGVESLQLSSEAGHSADDLNQFRRMYFRGFQSPAAEAFQTEMDHG